MSWWYLFYITKSIHPNSVCVCIISNHVRKCELVDKKTITKTNNHHKLLTPATITQGHQSFVIDNADPQKLPASLNRVSETNARLRIFCDTHNKQKTQRNDHVFPRKPGGRFGDGSRSGNRRQNHRRCPRVNSITYKLRARVCTNCAVHINTHRSRANMSIGSDTHRRFLLL